MSTRGGWRGCIKTSVLSGMRPEQPSHFSRDETPVSSRTCGAKLRFAGRGCLRVGSAGVNKGAMIYRQTFVAERRIRRFTVDPQPLETEFRRKVRDETQFRHEVVLSCQHPNMQTSP